MEDEQELVCDLWNDAISNVRERPWVICNTVSSWAGSASAAYAQ